MRERAEAEKAIARAASRLSASDLRLLAARIEENWHREAILAAVPRTGFAEVAAVVLDSGQTGGELAAYLRGLAAGLEAQADRVRVEAVWTGPRTLPVPVRATGNVLTEVVSEARHELAMMTYSAKPYEPVLAALAEAVGRGVTVTVVVETLAGAGSAMSGGEPAAAFASVAGIELWHWPLGKREEPGAKMHAKLAVADRRTLLISSANLTQSGVAKNIEAGLLVRGGTTPLRAAEHIAELRAKGVLERLR
ncbi:endonuclease [Nonomuraea phyllanthi]|uniref:DISARM system phospholipase D-like protein DrmC n=1 Tax=Nonomuraea phyllanthi TaxID=2219224 RepID=UPI001293F13F|nr:DISARM system phospholipase D-like protein DrmC [Nonomuraea phyllanthi]QFY12952.1 endonuclease [Nonomuraea phyllanthi]